MKLKKGKKSGLRYFDMKDIRSWEPCYNPSRHLPETFRGTAIDILKNEAIPIHDRFWVVLRPEIVSDKAMRLFAVWCFRQTLKFISNPDPRSIAAADVAERFALGKATEAELAAAEVRALAAWETEAYSAEYSAAHAAWAASTAASAAAWAASTAASAAAWAAEFHADSVAAWEAASAAQRDKLIEMIVSEGREAC